MLITAVGAGILHRDGARVLPANSTTVMSDIFYIVLKIHALTAPFLPTFSCTPCQRFIVDELTGAKIRPISYDSEAPWGQQEAAGRCLNSQSEQIVFTACPQPTSYFHCCWDASSCQKTPDFVSGWPCLRQTPLCSSAHGKQLPKNISTQLCHLLLPYIHVGICCMCSQMLLCGLQGTCQLSASTRYHLP